MGANSAADHQTRRTDATRSPGRPQKVDEGGTPTRSRLLTSAAAACVEFGFEGATLSDIARRADVSTPAIYNHFGSKSELMVEATRTVLESMARTGPRNPDALIDTYLSPAFADARVLQVELHLASLRHPDVRDLLAKWHGDNADEWIGDGAGSIVEVKAWYLFLLGLAHLDALTSLDAPADELASRAKAMAQDLFGNSEITNEHDSHNTDDQPVRQRRP